MTNPISQIRLYGLMATLAVIGAIGATIARLQGKQTVGDGTKWQHSWFQAFAMFIGESMWLGYYFVQKQLEKRKYGTRGMNPEYIMARKKGLKTDINVLLFAIPAACDWIGSGMIYFAYLKMPISVAEMMGGALVLITTVASVFFLRKRFFIYQWGSLIIIVGGVTMVGASSLQNDDDPTESPILGITLMLLAMWMQAVQMIVEEKLFRNYILSPLKVTGWQGVFGIIFYTVFLTIAYFINCSGTLCPSGRLEDSLKAITSLGENAVLMVLFIVLIVDVGVMNTLGATVTKYASWSNRATINTWKVVLVWAFFLLYPGDGGETFHWLQFGGFILIVAGTFAFNAQQSKTLPHSESIDGEKDALLPKTRKPTLNSSRLGSNRVESTDTLI